MSRLDLLAGPNGAGKTTLFERIISAARPGLPFVNADLIARQRWPVDTAAHAADASRAAAAAREALIDARIDFATETVFSHPSKVELVKRATEAGYDVVLHVLMVPLELSVERCRLRFEQGGHEVPPQVLAPRYERLWGHIADAVPTCHRVMFWDNSADDGPTLIASMRDGVWDAPPTWPSWTPDEIRRLRAVRHR